MASTPLDAETKATLDKLGSIKYSRCFQVKLGILTTTYRYIVGADALHHLYLSRSCNLFLYLSTLSA